MPQTGTTASVGSPLTGQKTSIKFFSGDQTKWLTHSYTNSLFVSNTDHPSTGEAISTFGFRDGNGNLSYISQKLNVNDPDNFYEDGDYTKYTQVNSLIQNELSGTTNISIPLKRSKDGYQYINIPNGVYLSNLHKNAAISDSVVYNPQTGAPIDRPTGIAKFNGNHQLSYSGVDILPQNMKQGSTTTSMGIINGLYGSDALVPTVAAVTSYVKTFATNNHYVTGSGLNANEIILGNGTSKIKTSGKTIQTGTITTYNDNSVPTNLAVCSYVTSRLNDVLGVSTTNISDLATAIQQIDAIVNDGESKGTGILAYIRTNSEKIVALESNVDNLLDINDHITPNSSNFATYLKDNINPTIVASMSFGNSSYLMDTLYLNDERKVNNWKTQNNMSVTKKHGGICADVSAVPGVDKTFNIYLKHSTEIETTDEEVTIDSEKMWVGKPDLYAISYDDYGHISRTEKVETDESLTIKYKRKSNGAIKSDYDFANGYIIPVICISDVYKEKINKIEEMLQYI